MRLITNKEEVANLHQKLVKKLNAFSTKKIRALTGHKGSSLEIDVYYSDKLDIWWINKFVEGKSGIRYWNAFGIGEPKPKRLAHIICEINYPKEGINRRVAANWIQDDNDFLLAHSGKIGGGRKGVGKYGFIEHYNGVFEDVDVEGLSKKITVIGNLKDPNLPYQIKNFVFEASRIKDILVRNTTLKSSSDPLDKIKHSFNEEFVGTKEYKNRKGKIATTANHGLIVNTLKGIISTNKLLVANDQQRDLYIYNKKAKIESVFEIKTSLKSQSIFTAVGQLYVNNIRLKPMPQLIYVIPEKPNLNLLKTLKKLNIKTLVFSWKDGKPIFKNLNKLIEC
ncbi:hypothetical protein [Aquimarina algiphila]|uniref:hypothetical protein n=1 Tax=Aquimarina algiphila TaxID=2047982 RepID=UPI00232B7521|nr:hypothetical protein [Aquimarina algiphila]